MKDAASCLFSLLSLLYRDPYYAYQIHCPQNQEGYVVILDHYEYETVIEVTGLSYSELEAALKDHISHLSGDTLSAVEL